MSKKPFEKFINKKPVGAKKKEIIRQEKKREKQELRAVADEWRKKNEDMYRTVTAKDVRPKTQDPRDNKKSSRDKDPRSKEEGFRAKDAGFKRPDARDNAREKGSRERTDNFKSKDAGLKKTNSRDREVGSKDDGFKRPASRDKDENFKRKDIDFKRPDARHKTEAVRSNDAGFKKFDSRDKESGFKEQRTNYKKQITAADTRSKFKPPTVENDSDDDSVFEPQIIKPAPVKNKFATTYAKPDRPKFKQGKPLTPSYDEITQKAPEENEDAEGMMPLNKYIAHGGVSGRREAAIFVKQGKVKVNGDVVYEPGYKVSPKDKVEVKDKLIFLQRNLVYILLNKPKDYITTAKDPEGRKTIFDLLKNATQERIYPVGRLDRNTTGVLLLTNDGELAQKLTHPSFEIKKLYEVTLDKNFSKSHMDAILNGVELEDGFIKADAVAYADSKDKSIIGIEIHSGRNRIVRRLFEHLGYDVKALDRVMFANLTKKNVERGKWRILNEKEIRLLKYMNRSFIRKMAEL